MKSVAAVVFLSLQLAGSAFAAHVTSHTEAESVLQERQRNLEEKTPLNLEEKDFLKRLLSEQKLRPVDLSEDRYASKDNDPLLEAMRKSGLAKLADNEMKDARKRKLQYYYNYNTNGYYGYNSQSKSKPQNTYVPPPAPKAEIPDKVSLTLEAFQDSRMVMANPPNLVTPESSYLTAGTQYLYSEEPLYNVVFDTPPGANRAVYLINERDRVAVVSGSCIRTDPKTNYVGRAYCQFQYTFLDARGKAEASLMAEGPLTKGDINTLSITGGSGIFRRAVGTVVLESGHIRSGNPPFFRPDDRLDLPSNYMAKFFLFMDSVDLEMM